MSLPLDSAAELLRLQASGDLTAVEIAQAALSRIADTEAAVRAFTYRADPLRVLEQAEQIDQDRQAGKPLGALAGVPVALKDVICTDDMPTSCSSQMLDGYQSPYQATVVERLKAAGALIVGKTNLDEFAMGASTETSAVGASRNPWDVSRTPGGSSGGTAAAVAAMNCPLGVGSDTGGSIRQPAAFCGLTGLKPTYGRVSRYGLVAFASSLDQMGPLAWDIEDCGLLLSTLAGHDPLDSTSLAEPVPAWQEALASRDLRRMRIGLLIDALDAEGLDPELRSAVLAAADVFRSLGATIVDLSLSHSRYWVPTYYVIAPCEASSNLSRYEGAHYGFRAEPAAADVRRDGPLLATYCQSREQGFGAEVKRRIMVGTYALSTGYYDAYYLQALKVRRLIRNDFDTAFGSVDLVLGPVTPTPAFRFGEKTDDPLQMYLCDLFTVGANLAGIPALTLPGGVTDGGLPIGVQLQAPPLQEGRLLQAAAAFQATTEHHRRRPQT
ncbi:Asp-tRNA(Asn)/Glu-tRNA(Gln) amidotransferase subunit GatA [Planctomycetaceae bacterium SH139]